MPTKSKHLGSNWYFVKGHRKEGRHGLRLGIVRHNGHRPIGLSLGWARSYVALFRAVRRSASA